MSISHRDAPDGQSGHAAEADHQAPHGRTFRRIAFASLIGTVIEAYDFALYGFAAAIVFPHIFFPSLGGAAGTVASLATLGVAFVARPVGAVVFGYFGDRFGRKSTLVATILGMGIGTALIGLLPSAATIGITAPILLVVLRAVQGIAIGGEWAGAVLFVTEHAPRERRGLYAMFPQLGATLATVLSAGTFLIVSLGVGEDTFVAWGWRIPFVGSLVMVAIGLYIRLKVEETPVFVKDRQREATARAPLSEAITKQPWTVLRGAGVALTTVAFVYVAQSFLSSYGVSTLRLSQNQVFAATAVSGVFYAAGAIVSGVLADRMSRRTLIAATEIAGAGWALALFPVLAHASSISFAIALSVTLGIAGLAYGAIGAYLPEQFPTRYRYTASGISYQITGVIGGGVAPLLAPIIVSAHGTTTFGVVLAGLSAVAAVCTLSLKDKAKESMDWSLDNRPSTKGSSDVGSGVHR